jgi:hypothetical protein
MRQPPRCAVRIENAERSFAKNRFAKRKLRRARPHATPSQLQKWTLEFHEPRAPLGSLLIARLKSRREARSVSSPSRVVQLTVPAPQDKSKITMAHGMSEHARFHVLLSLSSHV